MLNSRCNTSDTGDLVLNDGRSPNNLASPLNTTDADSSSVHSVHIIWHYPNCDSDLQWSVDCPGFTDAL